MANKKVSQLTSKPSVLVTDLFPIADPTTGQLFKTTISALGTAIGSGVSSVNTLVGAVVLDTDDIQELASPTNRWFTDTRARAALSASSPLAYNSGTGVFSIAQANGSTNGFLSSADWTTFNAKQAALSGTGFVKISGTTISYDNSTYLTTSAAASTYLALAGGTLTGALNGTSATFTGDLTLSATNPRLYFTDTDNNPDYFISNTDGTFTIYDVTNSTSRFTIGTTGNGNFGGNLTVGQIIRTGGTSGQFLKADGSVDSTAYVSGSGIAGRYAIWDSSGVISYGCISAFNNITYVDCLGLNTQNGIEIEGNFGGGSGGLKIKSYDETTGKAFMEFMNTSGVFRLGIEGSTGGGILPGSTAYATVLTSGLTAKNLEFGTNNTKRMTIDGTTGAVTFAGALSGTSATFSGNVTAQGGYLYGQSTNSFVRLDNTIGTQIGFLNYADITFDSDGLRFYTGTGTSGSRTQKFFIASTGAATFSSSVTATKLSINSTDTGGDGLVQIVASAGTLGDSSKRRSLSVFSTTAENADQPGVILGYDTAGAGIIAARTNSSGQPLAFWTYNGSAWAERMRIRAGGSVGINTSGQDSVKLQVKADSTGSTNYAILLQDSSSNDLLYVRADGLISTGLAGNSPYNLTRVGRAMIVDSSGLIGYLASTRESKINISDLTDISFLYKLNPKSFNYRKTNQISNEYTNEYNNDLHYGLIADEVEKVNKELVFYDEKNGIKELAGVEYQKLTSVLIKAVQELKAELDTLKNK